MANLKTEITEKAIIAGKIIDNKRTLNIINVNNIYQEIVKLDKRPASYTYSL